MKEIIWHGRGGQGAFTAARLLGAAFTANDDMHFALSFPTFGPERRGAPVMAFTKLSVEPVGDRSQVKKGDYVIFLDETLYLPKAEEELKEGGRIIVNSQVPRGQDNENVIRLDATAIALETLGRPICNTIMLGALAGLDGDITTKDIEAAIREYMPPALHDANIAAVRKAADAVNAK